MLSLGKVLGLRHVLCLMQAMSCLTWNTVESHRSRSVEINGVAHRQLSLAHWVLLQAAGIASSLVFDRPHISLL